MSRSPHVFMGVYVLAEVCVAVPLFAHHVAPSSTILHCFQVATQMPGTASNFCMHS